MIYLSRELEREKELEALVEKYSEDVLLKQNQIEDQEKLLLATEAELDQIKIEAQPTETTPEVIPNTPASDYDLILIKEEWQELKIALELFAKRSKREIKKLCLQLKLAKRRYMKLTKV